jgi:hypothetical protein
MSYFGRKSVVVEVVHVGLRLLMRASLGDREKLSDH